MRLTRLAVGWTLLDGASPFYPLYALLFLAGGLTGGQVSALFAVWSLTGFLAEVPAGVLADRWSRRGCLVLSAVLEAAGFALWTAAPGFPSFAAGFVLWGLGGALASGAAEALVYDGLAALGEAAAYPRANGRIAAARLLAQLPGAALATGLLALGGWSLVGWASVALCLVTAAVATRLPEPPHGTTGDDDGIRARAVLADLRRPAVLLAVLAVAVVGGIDAVEEYWPVLASDWGVPTAVVPLAVVTIPLTGALGAALAGRWPGLRPVTLLASAGVLLGLAALWARPAALAAVAVAYGCYLAVLVVVEARLQERLPGRHRATLTSVAALGLELASLGVFAAWAVGGALAVAVLVLAAVPLLAIELGPARRRPRRRWPRAAPP